MDNLQSHDNINDTFWVLAASAAGALGANSLKSAAASQGYRNIIGTRAVAMVVVIGYWKG